ncbi:histidinol-phosphate aminotransferase [Propionibacteriaceae bacterium ES.041]|uniref:histidinol-phosphate transaminase n=1 Tax=Enemella evansiae TaxID=2016499 RepID=UPI000B9767BB|nr:histidinol-phosphate transaminase [Enemella evansiae]OYO03229.1 aminotransferase [Enemella evansiae]PFG65917.1 histidinol-phosphate aminotransferase [Propionibacteriaceae bacterium ES.041]
MSDSGGVRIRACIRALPAYRAGKPATAGPDGRAYKLSSNENPYPPLPSVLAAVDEASRGMNRYPDAGNRAVAEATAELLGGEVGPEHLAFGTGSVAVLFHALTTVCDPGDEVVYAWRSFEAYPIGVQLTGAKPVPVPLRPDCTHDLPAMLAAIGPRTRAVMLCTPNNPTGPTIRHTDLIDFCDRVPEDVLVIVDEAYVEFVTDPEAARGLDAWTQRPNVIVLRTYSKAFGLAGFRVGYAVARAELATAMRAVALPFGVSVPAQAAVVASVRAKDELMAQVKTLIAARDELADSLRGLGIEVPESQGNFVWLPAGERTTAWGEHFAAHGLMTRAYAAGDAFDGVRVSVGEPEANARVLEVAKTLPR